ncbi:chlamydia 15 kDa cysteine-rich outer membrane family protein [Chlamydia ibidis]|uniref:Chlamydia 15 kDa cysteine-rich outer membrane family protein n=2 Tax=Chlamydia ibidis TaxID=1405396 RepID=S7KGZ4_9CHLA|nr:cysteine-rich outer membrane protein [Chlamydia ibidis]EPP35451.1 chlamydia 15 kDa cysteine-rich outer membrane family protein [Chlamydia ibidis]EQM63140.1 chlamydia 15 kDa cysteine-rich outer membrane family protein [Chlamydia ibidis 10-1398/6]
MVTQTNGIKIQIPETIQEAIGINVSTALENDQVQLGLVNAGLSWVKSHIIVPMRSSPIVKSRGFQISMIVLGILLVVSGLALTFVLQAELGKNAFLFLIPAVIGLVKLLVTSLCMEDACTPEQWGLFKNLLSVTEDLIDDGELNHSNKIFVSSVTDGKVEQS